MLDDVEFKIAKLDLGEGDILVMRTKVAVTSVIAAQIKAQTERILGGKNKVMVVPPDIDLSVISKSDAKKLSLK